MIQVGKTIQWWIRSTENPLWNCEGSAVIRPGGGPPAEIVNTMYDLQQEHGDKPEDLTWGYG